MIFGKLSQDNGEYHSLPTGVHVALQYLKQTDLLSLKVGQYSVQGNDIFALVKEYQTVPKTEKLAEQHRRYMEIQYIVAGQELVGVGVENSANEVVEQYNPEKERALYGKVANEEYVSLSAGDYVIFFPADIHRPGCSVDQPSQVKKVVVKIAVK